MFGEAHWSLYVDGVTNITDTNCSDGVRWPWVILHDCVHDDRGIASDVLGLLSLVAWLIVSLPQMVMNCRNIRGVEGISMLLIVQWTLGDATNLIGSILTNQLPLQTYLAVYFVMVDVVLFGQYIYYQYWKWKRFKSNLKVQASGPSRIVLCFTGAFIMVNSLGMAFSGLVPKSADATPHIRGGRHLMSTNLTHVQFFKGIKDESGYAIGIVSSLFYIGSRLSQLYKNHRRNSTEGLSVMMFALAVVGNITYGLSILVRSQEEYFLLHHLPWLVGSIGVIFLDIALLLQFKYYAARDFDILAKQPLADSEVRDDSTSIDYMEVTAQSNGGID